MTGMGRKFALLISRNVEPFARLTIVIVRDICPEEQEEIRDPALPTIAMNP